MSLSRPRGPLPARVYWVRRAMVLGVVFGLVFGISRLLGAGSDGSDGAAATPAAAVGSSGPTPTATATVDAQPVTSPTSTPTPSSKRKKKTRVRVPLAEPTGPCQDRDVRVVPAMQDNAYAGGDVPLTLELRTFRSPACNWRVSAHALVVRLTSGSDRIWTSQQCPHAVPDQAVVLRKRRPVIVDVTWSGRRSDSGCSRNTLWAEPGWYHVAAAAMGSEPESQQFELHSPAPVTITPSPTPRPKAKAGRSGGAKPGETESSD